MEIESEETKKSNMEVLVEVLNGCQRKFKRSQMKEVKKQENQEYLTLPADHFKKFLENFSEMLENGQLEYTSDKKYIVNQLNEFYTTNQYDKFNQIQKNKETVKMTARVEEDFDDEENFILYQKKGKNLQGNKKQSYLKPLYQPIEYGMNKVVQTKKFEMKRILQRYDVFYCKYKSYLDKLKDFQKEIDQMPNMDMIVVIMRVIILDEDLRDSSSQKIYLEYRTKEGLEYVEGTLQNIKDYFLFSNQMILVKGNLIMEKFNIEQVLNNHKFQMTYSPLKAIPEDDFGGKITIMNICGPFIGNNFENYLFDFCQKTIREHKVTHLIVRGPIHHYSRKAMQMNNDYDTIMNNFMTDLNSLSSGKLKIILIVDFEEINNFFKIPNESLFCDKPNITCPPNPCILQLGSFRIGVTQSTLYDQLILHCKYDGQITRPKILSALLETNNLHPLNAEKMRVSDIAYNMMNYQEKLDLLLLTTKTRQSFIEKMEKIFILCQKSLKQENTFGEYSIVELVAGESPNVKLYVNN